MKLFKTALTALSICTYMAGAYAADYSNPDEIKCISSVCKKMSRGQLDQLDRIIDNQILERNISEGTQNIAIIVEPEKVDVLKKAFMSSGKSESLTAERTETFMTFRYSDDQKSFYSANVYLAKNMLNQQEYVRMNTIGFGRQLKEGWLVEIEVIKNFDKNKKFTSDLKPNGLLLSLRRRW